MLWHENKIPHEKISISSLNSLPFPCRKLSQDNAPITLCNTLSIKKSEFATNFNQLNCEQIDYTSADTGIHRLPVNFNCSASEYHKLVITNGKSKKTIIQTKVSPLEVQNVECLNVPIYLKIQQQKIESAKQIKKANHNGKNQHYPDTTSCVCCCCVDYCLQCNQEVKAKQIPKGGSCPNLHHYSSLKALKHHTVKREQTQIIESKKVLNQSKAKKRQKRIRKEQKSVKAISKKSKQVSKATSCRDLAIQKIIKQSLANYRDESREKKRLEYIEQVKAYENKKRLNQFTKKVKLHNKVYSQDEFVQKYPWGIDQKRVEKAHERPTYKCSHIIQKGNIISQFFQGARQNIQSSKSKQSISSENVKCHPIANVSAEHRQIMKKIHFEDAMKQIKKAKETENQRRSKTKQKLKDLQVERKRIIENNPKKKFSPKAEFEIPIQPVREKPQTTNQFKVLHKVINK